MPTIKIKTTFLEMRSPPAARLEPPCEGVEIAWSQAPGIEDYLAWYITAGEAWQWVDRLQWAPEKLQALLDDPAVDVHLLLVDQQPAGFVEIDRRKRDDVEILYFGLFPAFIGRGLGKYFLNAIVHSVWDNPPTRLWLHTCELDSPAALPNYLKAGFEVFEEKLRDKVVS